MSGNLKDRGSLCIIQSNRKKQYMFLQCSFFTRVFSSGSVEMEHAYVYTEEIR